MATTLEILNNFVLTVNGVQFSLKQGAAADVITEAYTMPTVTSGVVNSWSATLATATVVKVYDSANQPTTFNYGFIWSDQALTVQEITAATNVCRPLIAFVPYTFATGTLLAAASTSAITGNSAPSLAALASVYLGNYSGNTANYTIAFIK